MECKPRNLGSIIVDKLREEFLRKTLEEIRPKGPLLDLGCGNRPFQKLYKRCTTSSIGMDVPSSPHDLKYIDVCASGSHLPFKDSSFEIVICTEVLEHVPEPEDFLIEVNTALKPGGYLLLTVPFLVPLHEVPNDFYRYTSYGLTHLLKKAGFTIYSIEPFSEIVGVLISFFVQIQLKIWRIPTRNLKYLRFDSILNPLVFLLVYLPQQFYIYTHQLLEKQNLLCAVRRTASYTTKGYGVIARKEKG